MIEMVTDEGGGRYLHVDIDPRNQGIWKKKVEIECQDTDDPVVLSLPVVR